MEKLKKKIKKMFKRLDESDRNYKKNADKFDDNLIKLGDAFFK